MHNFIEMPASKNSLAKRKPVCGVGINDSSYIVQPVGGGKCPYYTRWDAMIKRCYLPWSMKCNCYVECYVSDEWLTFSNFRKWMIKQKWQDCDLDKDLLKPGNKIYSPEFCIFVPRSLNTLLGSSGISKGEWPQGVYFNKWHGKFQAACKAGKKRNHLGWFTTPEEAFEVYRKFKSNYIAEVAESYRSNERLYDGLIRHAELISPKPSTNSN